LLTLAAPVAAEFVIRQSRFVAHASPVADQAATLLFFAAVADPAASHNCWAWKLDHGYRFNDDGEPAGTAGKPILTAIEGKHLCRVMVVVTRYFGGIKLGIGGLIRAYSGCAAKCLDQGRIIEIHPTSRYIIEAGFEWTGQVHKLLETCSAVKEEERFTASGVCLKFELRDDQLRKLQTLLRDATRGTATLRPV
jgi:uncharacterized YigZ family protein